MFRDFAGRQKLMGGAHGSSRAFLEDHELVFEAAQQGQAEFSQLVQLFPGHVPVWTQTLQLQNNGAKKFGANKYSLIRCSTWDKRLEVFRPANGSHKLLNQLCIFPSRPMARAAKCRGPAQNPRFRCSLWRSGPETWDTRLLVPWQVSLQKNEAVLRIKDSSGRQLNKKANRRKPVVSRCAANTCWLL